MPGFNLHVILARTVFDAGLCPGDDPVCRAALFAGSIAPDMGFFHGGEKFLSDLAHFVRTGRLARTLFLNAPTRPAQAFALGWVTHVLGDALIHPLVNREAATLTRHARDVLTFDESPIAHIRVEQGLDAILGARFLPREESPAEDVRTPEGTPEAVASAYKLVYGLAVGPQSRRSCRALDGAVSLLKSYGRVVAWRLGEPKATAPRWTERLKFFAFRQAVGWLPESAAYGFAHPAAPSEETLGAVMKVIASFPGQIARLLDDDLADLPDYNLSTGEIVHEFDPSRVGSATRAERDDRVAGAGAAWRSAEPALIEN